MSLIKTYFAKYSIELFLVLISLLLSPVDNLSFWILFKNIFVKLCHALSSNSTLLETVWGSRYHVFSKTATAEENHYAMTNEKRVSIRMENTDTEQFWAACQTLDATWGKEHTTHQLKDLLQEWSGKFHPRTTSWPKSQISAPSLCQNTVKQVINTSKGKLFRNFMLTASRQHFAQNLS